MHILDTEIHAIREGLGLIFTQGTPQVLHICVDKRQALRIQGGGGCRVKVDLKECQNGIMTIQQAGCNVKGQWTPLHKGIPRNEHTDKLGDQAQKEPLSQHNTYTITWTAIKSRNHLRREWIRGPRIPHSPSPGKSTPTLASDPSYQAAGILRLKCKMTNYNENYNNPSPTCICGHLASRKQTLLRCPGWTSKQLQLADGGFIT